MCIVITGQLVMFHLCLFVVVSASSCQLVLVCMIQGLRYFRFSSMNLSQPLVSSSEKTMNSLLQQLRQDELRLIKARQAQNNLGTLGSLAKKNADWGSQSAKTFDFPLPGSSGRIQESPQVPTPPHRKGLSSGKHNIAAAQPIRVPDLSGSQQEALAREGGLPYAQYPQLASQDQQEAPRVATPRATTPRSSGVFTASNEGSRPTSRVGSSCSHRSCTPEDERLARLEQMLLEEKVGRLEMLEKVNALAKLVAEQNTKLTTTTTPAAHKKYGIPKAPARR